MDTISQRLWSLSLALCVSLACPACSEQRTTVPAPSPPVSLAAPVESGNQPPREQVMTLTPRAAERLRLLRDNGKLKPNAVVRFSVLEGNYFRLRNGGDKRYRYHMVIDDDPKDIDNDLVMESQGLTIHVEKSSAEFLRGTELLWVDTGGKGGFKFQNPNEMGADEAAAGEVVPVADPDNSNKASGPTPLNE